MLYDFHTHTFFSDGELSPLELISRAAQQGYTAIGLTDHVGIGSLSRVLEEIALDCALARERLKILAIPGVELTYVPPEAIAEIAQQAKALGAWLVIVHGETLVEPVPQGTNRAALASPHVDILAHPGLISPEDAELAAQNGVFLEITSRRGHSLSNGHICRLTAQYGAKLLLNSDAHSEDDLLTEPWALSVAQGSGLTGDEARIILFDNAQQLLAKLPLPEQH